MRAVEEEYQEALEAIEETPAAEIYEETAEGRTLEEVIENPTQEELQQEQEATQEIAPPEIVQKLKQRFGLKIKVVDDATLMSTYNPYTQEIMIGKNATTGEVLYQALAMEIYNHLTNVTDMSYSLELYSAVNRVLGYDTAEQIGERFALHEELGHDLENATLEEREAMVSQAYIHTHARMFAAVFGNENSLQKLAETAKPTMLQRMMTGIKSFLNKALGLKTAALTPMQRAERAIEAAFNSKQYQKSASNVDYRTAEAGKWFETNARTEMGTDLALKGREQVRQHEEETARRKRESQALWDKDPQKFLESIGAMPVDQLGETRQYAMRDATGGELVMDEKEITENKEYVANMKPVIKLSGNQFAKNADKDFKTMAHEYLGDDGINAENPRLGVVNIGMDGIEHLIGALTHRRSAMLPAVKTVIEKGRIIQTEKNHKGHGYDTAVIAGVVSLDGKDYYMGVAVRENADGTNGYYVHDAVVIEKRNSLPNKSGLVTAG